MISSKGDHQADPLVAKTDSVAEQPAGRRTPQAELCNPQSSDRLPPRPWLPPTRRNIELQNVQDASARAATSSGEQGGSGSRTVDFSNLSSGSGHALDQAIDALRRDGAIEDGASEVESHDDYKDVRFLRTLNSISSVEGRETKEFMLATPFAAQALQDEDLPSRDAAHMEDYLPGPHSSLSAAEQDMYRLLVEELTMEGTLSSEFSSLFSDMCASGLGSGNLPEERGVVEAYREQLDGMVEKLRTRLPPAKAQALRHFDSFGLLEVYNSHHHSASGVRRGSGGLTRPFVGGTAMSQPT